jgi:hypothetical protein
MIAFGALHRTDPRPGRAPAGTTTTTATTDNTASTRATVRSPAIAGRHPRLRDLHDICHALPYHPARDHAAAAAGATTLLPCVHRSYRNVDSSFTDVGAKVKAWLRSPPRIR